MYDELEWWEMPKPSPQWLEYQRIEKEKRQEEWRAEMRSQSEVARLKKKLIKERGPFCERCGQKPERLHAHHIQHKAHGGSNEPSNLILLCRDCHQLEHKHGVGR